MKRPTKDDMGRVRKAGHDQAKLITGAGVGQTYMESGRGRISLRILTTPFFLLLISLSLNKRTRKCNPANCERGESPIAAAVGKIVKGESPVAFATWVGCEYIRVNCREFVIPLKQ